MPGISRGLAACWIAACWIAACWIAVKSDGMVLAIGLERPWMEPLFSLPDVGLDFSREITIHVSPDGALAALVNTK